MSETARAKIPTSRAKTAYGLLSEIASLALEEPKRIAMSIWSTKEGDTPPTDRYPKCGTVGCIGGWASILRGNSSPASELLGIEGRQIDELFYDDRLMADPHQQTRRHAMKVVAHIRRFQKKYLTQLKATKL